MSSEMFERPRVGSVIPLIVDDYTEALFGEPIVWEPNSPFRATYTFRGFSRHDSGHRVEFLTEDGRRQLMLPSEVEAMILSGVPLGTAPIHGMWECRRRGRLYGLSYVGPATGEIRCAS